MQYTQNYIQFSLEAGLADAGGILGSQSTAGLEGLRIRSSPCNAVATCTMEPQLVADDKSTIKARLPSICIPYKLDTSSAM